MTDTPVETYQPRAVSHHGIAEVDPLRFKIYGLAAPGRQVQGTMIATARDVLTDAVVARVAEMGDSNDLGFVIVHPGETGLSISAHWWVQGSVLCQHFHRHLYGVAVPMDTAGRPVIGCVWELAIIQAEQMAWRESMMGAELDPERYLAARISVANV